jgi:hypothetical protein
MSAHERAAIADKCTSGSNDDKVLLIIASRMGCTELLQVLPTAVIRRQSMISLRDLPARKLGHESAASMIPYSSLPVRLSTDSQYLISEEV